MERIKKAELKQAKRAEGGTQELTNWMQVVAQGLTV
jgi:hypothetical protein